MATTFPALVALINDTTQAGATTIGVEDGVGRRGIAAWDAFPPRPMTAAQRTAVSTALLAGNVTTLADVLALIATAATGGVTQHQVYRLVMGYNDPVNG